MLRLLVCDSKGNLGRLHLQFVVHQQTLKPFHDYSRRCIVLKQKCTYVLLLHVFFDAVSTELLLLLENSLGDVLICTYDAT